MTAARLVIFDFDGTLADTFPFFIGAFDGAADRYRFRRLDRANLPALRGLDARAMMAHHGVAAWKLPLIARHMRRAMRREIGGIRLFDGVAEMLAALEEAGIALALVTSNSRENVLAVMGPECARRFGQLECGVALFGKQAKMDKVLARAGVGRAEAILVGDELRDAQAAARAGIRFAGVAWGFNEGALLARHGPLFGNVAALRAHLLGEVRNAP